MKMAYNKPDVIFDSFSLSQSIASPCEIRANHQEGNCGVVFTEAITLFNNGVSPCSWHFEDGEFDGLCYHVPFEDYNVFAS